MENITFEFDKNENMISVIPSNVVLNCGNAKIVFDKQQICIDDVLDVYIKLKNYLNTFDGIYL
jgi:hypothetical protein